jgi:hypothetical protein
MGKALIDIIQTGEFNRACCGSASQSTWRHISHNTRGRRRRQWVSEDHIILITGNMAVAVATVVDSLALGAAVADAAVMEVAVGEVMEIEESGRGTTSSSTEAAIEGGLTKVSHTCSKIVYCK